MVKRDLKKGKKFLWDEKFLNLCQVRNKEIKQTEAHKQIDVPRSTFSEKYNKWQDKNKKNNNQ